MRIRERFVRELYSLITLLILSGAFTPFLNAQFNNVSQIHESIDPQKSKTLPGTTSPRLASLLDEGLVSGNLPLSSLALHFRLTPKQQTDLERLTRDQQTPGSDRYHHWISPEQYASRYGLNQSDLAAIETWLQYEGFSQMVVNTSRTALFFSGTTGQVERVFGTTIHRYAKDGGSVLANLNDLRIPKALTEVVETLTGVDQLRPSPAQLLPDQHDLSFQSTAGQAGRRALSPADVASIYNLSPLYNTNITGKGQRIAVIGQSAVDLNDVARFRLAAGLTSHLPALVLVPGTGAATRRSGDELESDTDLEYAGAIAPDADILLVYTGSNPSSSVYDALAYAVDQDIAPIISFSYAECEQGLSKSELKRVERLLLQANSQGQTVVAASGDQGATGCDDAGSDVYAVKGLAVDYPASSEYVTAVGGTMFAEEPNSWLDANSAEDGSVKGYVPELAWNETGELERPAILGTGGGLSQIFLRPSWQVAQGVPSAAFRAVPDLAVNAGVHHLGYLLCSSDAASKVQGSCSRGFLDATGFSPLVGGGTSFGAPIVAGIFALANQMSGEAHQGNLNRRLYALSALYPAVYHDIEAGNNRVPCARGTKDCVQGSPIGYDASSGYDLVTGLGSPDGERLVRALASRNVESSYPTNLELSVQNSAESADSSVSFTAVVSSVGGTPSGTVQFSIDDQLSGGPITVRSGQASYTVSTLDVGSHYISAAFTSDSGFAASSASLQTETAAMANPATFSLTGSEAFFLPMTGVVAQITVTPHASYSGTIRFSLAVQDARLLQYGCYAIADLPVKGVSAAQGVLYVGRSATQCNALEARMGGSLRRFNPIQTAIAHPVNTRRNDRDRLGPNSASGVVAACWLLGLLPCSARKRSIAAVLIVSSSAVALLLAGCGSTIVNGSAGTGQYTLQVTGTDLQRPSISSTTEFQIVVQ